MTRSSRGPGGSRHPLTPARGRERGSGPLSPCAGVTLVEVLAVLAIAATVGVLVAPGATHLQASVSMRSATSETTTAFSLARAYAIRRGVYVGLKFRKNGDRYEWTVYRDGNGNGIRTVDIDRGIDRPVGLFFPWSRNDVRPGILTGTPVPDPSDPDKNLDRLDDPIRFNSSDICSFSPLGESTSGSVFLWDSMDRMGVVRIFGRRAKIHTLYYRRGETSWKP